MVTDNLGNYIKEKGITITRIAEKTGIDYQILANCFDIKITAPSPKMLAVILITLNFLTNCL